MSKYTFELNQAQDEMHIQLDTPRLEAACISEFKEGLDQNWKPSIHHVSIDCKQVEFIDSSGIGALLSVQKRLAKENAVTLLNTQAAVMSVIELLRLHRIFNLKNS